LRVRQQLEVRFEEAPNPIEEDLREQLVDIVRDMQLELFDVYKSSRTEEINLAMTASCGDASEATMKTQGMQGQGQRSAVKRGPEASKGVMPGAQCHEKDTQVGDPSLESTWDWGLSIEEQVMELGELSGFIFDIEQPSDTCNPSLQNLGYMA
jgi:hypothetical protein